MASPAEVTDALRTVADPCCRERGINVVDMGLIQAIDVDGNEAAVDIVLTSGWCPFQVDLVETITAAVQALPDIARASVRIVLDDVWSTERMDPGARAKLRFLPDPGQVADRDAYVAGRLPVTATAPAVTATTRGDR